jgi:hypothetical protein
VAAYLLGQSTGFTPPAPQSTAASHCDANIQVIQGSQQGIASGLIHPLLLGVQGQRPTLTQKHQGGWCTFAKNWEQHMLLVSACNKGSQSLTCFFCSI